MEKEPQYLYFDELNNSWQATTLTQLAILDNPDLLICPIEKDGIPGAQTTYAEFIKSRATEKPEAIQPPKTVTHDTRTTCSKTTAKAPIPLPQQTPLDAITTNDLINIIYTCNYIRNILSVFTVLCFAGAGALVWESNRPSDGFIIGLIAGIFIIILIQLASKPESEQQKNASSPPPHGNATKHRPL